MKRRKSARRDPASPGSIFVVDDNATLVEFAARVLESAGYQVRYFCDPKAVLQALQKADPKPEVLVTDYDMEGMNGLELIISSHRIHPRLKTVILSGTVDFSMTSTHPARVHRFLGKPYEPAQLKNVVAELLTASS
ncbi:MAG: response regulator [Verrucomicrobiota bacterium]|jgi:DNA-binding NtrC family response regulator